MYNYVDSEGHLQTVQYVADAQGFRVAGTNIPGEATNTFDPIWPPLYLISCDSPGSVANVKFC